MKKRTIEQDYLKACRKAAREEQIARHGRPPGVWRIHRSKKAYDRKRTKAGLKDLPDFFAGREAMPTEVSVTDGNSFRDFCAGFFPGVIGRQLCELQYNQYAWFALDLLPVLPPALWRNRQ